MGAISQKTLIFPKNYQNSGGIILGAICKKNNVKEAVFDTGTIQITQGNKIFSVLSGCLDGGLNIPHSKDKFPSEERIKE